MAIKEFKEVIDRRGYLVEKEDRKIFEKEIKKSNFGMGYSDTIEFILYDSSDNQLPQGEDGKLVRYISIDDANFNQYFLISETNYTKKINGAPEFLIDLEKLIREAGYSSGIFKTQVTLLNRRVGTEEVDTDGLWIHEISPSRTEVRLLPLKNKNNKDLLKRYNIFLENGNFRDDTIYYAIPFIENINLEKVFNNFLLSKGNVETGKSYINLIKSEFKVDDIELLLKRIRDKYIESMKYFISNRVWNINDINYGKSSASSEKIELSISTIRIVALQCLTNSIEYYLPKRDIREVTGLTKQEQKTFDEVKEILKSAVSNTEYDSSVPSKIDAIIRGCMDLKAINYNPNAKEDDGTCRYGKRDIDLIKAPDKVIGDIDEVEIIKGCTDPTALNYNEKANLDNGSCQYKSQPKQVTKTWYVWSPTATMKYKSFGEIKSISGKEYDSFTLTYDDATFKFPQTDDVREVPKVKEPAKKLVSYTITNVTYNTMKRPVASPTGKYSTGIVAYDTPIFVGNSITFTYRDKNDTIKTSSVLQPGESIVVCAVRGTVSTVPGITIIENGSCSIIIDPPPPKIKGCTDPTALNFNRLAEIENGTCKYKIVVEPISGCTDSSAKNYNPNATRDDGTCIYPKVTEPTPIIVTNPPISSGGGGGGGRPAGDIFEINQDPINPFSNRGDFVTYRVNDRQMNIK